MYLYMAFLPILTRFSPDTNDLHVRLFYVYLGEFTYEGLVGPR